MAKRMMSYFAGGNARLFARSATLAGGVENDSAIYVDIGSPTATGGTVLTATSINTTSAISMDTTFTAAETQMTRWGRGLALVASGATSVVVTVKGRDYLGQYMREDVTLNGTTPVNTVKAFRYVDSVTPQTAAAVNLGITTINKFGLPYKYLALELETKNGAAAVNAGTFVAGLATGTTATATNADVRGTYTPATVLPDGTNTFALRYYVDHVNAFGNAQYFA